jgi:hypothetical protein
MKTKSGKTKGLLFAFDLLEVGSFGVKEEEKKMTRYVYKQDAGHQNSLSIHIDTMSRASDIRVGIYEMTVLKKITGTENFLALPDETKNCQLEPLENIKRRRYAEEAVKECGCVPWALSSVLPEQVGRGWDTPHISRSRPPATAPRTAPTAGLALMLTPPAAETPVLGSMLILMFARTTPKRNL